MLAHELTHVVQQSAAGQAPVVQRDPLTKQDIQAQLAALEKEASTADPVRAQQLYQEREELVLELKVGAPDRKEPEPAHERHPIFGDFKPDKVQMDDPCPTCHSHGFGKLSKQDRMIADLPWSLIENPRTPFEQEKMYSGPKEGLQPVWNFKISKEPVGYKKTNESTEFNTWYFDINGKLVDIREPGLGTPEWYLDPLNFIPVEGIGSLGATGVRGFAKWGAEMLGNALIEGGEKEGVQVLTNLGTRRVLGAGEDVADSVVDDVLAAGEKETADEAAGDELAGIANKAVNKNVDRVLKGLGLPKSALTVLPNGKGAFIYEARTGVLRVIGHGKIPKAGDVLHAGYNATELGQMIKQFPGKVTAVDLQGCNLGATDFPELINSITGLPVKSYAPKIVNATGERCWAWSASPAAQVRRPLN